MKFKVKRATVKQAGLIRTILREAHLQNTRNGFRFPAYKNSIKRIKNLIRRDRYYLLWVDGNAAGTVAAKKRRNYFEIGSLGVLPSHRGKGFGRELLRYAERKSQKRGATHVVLFTPHHHPTLPAYYRKQGYYQKGTKRLKGELWIRFEKALL